MLVAVYKSIVAMFMSLISLLSFGAAADKTAFTPKDSENVKLTFATMSDTHMTDSVARKFMLELGLSDMENSQRPLDAMIITGDITNHGYESEWIMTQNAFASYSPAKEIIFAEGNHDTWTDDYSYQPSLDLFVRFNKEICGRDIDKAYYSTEINGYTFIVMASEDDGVDAYISEEQFAWLEETLEDSASDGLPVFLVFHQPLNKTHGLPGTWGEDDATEITGGIGDQSDRVEAILQQYKNIIYISGHIHNGMGDSITSATYGYKSVETYGNITSVNLPAYSFFNSRGQFLSGLGFVFEVYDNEIIIRGRSYSSSIWHTEYEYSIPIV